MPELVTTKQLIEELKFMQKSTDVSTMLNNFEANGFDSDSLFARIAHETNSTKFLNKGELATLGTEFKITSIDTRPGYKGGFEWALHIVYEDGSDEGNISLNMNQKRDASFNAIKEYMANVTNKYAVFKLVGKPCKAGTFYDVVVIRQENVK
jgi:hypothetical protein